MINIATFTPNVVRFAENINTIFFFQNQSTNEGSFPDAWWRKNPLLLKESFHCSYNFVVSFILYFFADQMLDLYVFHYFLYASFVIYISMDETIFLLYRVGQFIMVEETGVPRIVLYNVEWKLIG